LQIDEDQAGPASIGHTYVDWLTTRPSTHARLNDEAVSVSSNLPAFTVWEPPMGESSLTPSAVEEPDAAILISHITGCGLNHGAVEVKLQGRLPSLGL
jgi:hypothetical protein